MLEPFILDEQSSLLRIKDWEDEVPGLVAGFTTRMGGISQSPYQSLNCGLHVNDDSQHVIQNREHLCRLLKFPFESWTCANQVHGNHVAIIDKQMIGSGRYSQAEAIPDTDGLLTAAEQILLTSFYADCVPLLFLVPEKRMIGIAHAGWKGTALNISQKIVESLNNHFNVKPDRIKAAIGPSIGGCCYEVDDRVISSLSPHFPDQLKDPFVSQKENGRYTVDLKQVNRLLLIKAGVPAEQILTSKLCTGCRTDLFFSHRMEGGKTGRMAAFLGLRSEV